jgi:hypothetical protein
LEKEADDAGKTYAQANGLSGDSTQLKKKNIISNQDTPDKAFELAPEIQLKTENGQAGFKPATSTNNDTSEIKSSAIEKAFQLEEI